MPDIAEADAPPAVRPAYASTTTLAAIRAASPCEDGWRKLLANLGKSCADDEPLALLTVLDSNGLDDALWVLSYAMPDDRLERHFKAWCAERVLHVFEAERPGDVRVRAQIEMLRRDDASQDERAAARSAAWAAVRAAARGAARDAAWAAVWDAAWAALRSAVWDAARDAARAAVWDAARDPAWAAARDVERDVAWGAERAAQERQLRLMLAEAA